jgi:predicted nuclease of restriction endonuclease-like (RecB) superfamily
MDGISLPGPMACLPWGHNILLVEKLSYPLQRLWYAQQIIEHGWSRAVLLHQIDTGAHERQGKAITNFARTLPEPRSDLAREVLKDPYHFDFLALGPAVKEEDVRRGLLKHLRDFLIELGTGFAYVGTRYHLEVGGQDYYLDLLFYHLRLRSFIVVELKLDEFEPEHAGKMNFYLSAVDDLLLHPEDRPSIGLILCRRKNRVIVEYSLRDTTKPMGVASYQLRRDALPDPLRDSLPSVELIEAELGQVRPDGESGEAARGRP